MKKNILTIVLAMLCLFFKTDAQSQNANIKPLNIGDTIPEAVWNMPLQVVNHPQGKKTITLSDYKGKLIILDFWATWCSSCIANFPKIEVIQDELGQKIQILGVSYEVEKKINNFFAAKSGKNYEVTSVVDDSTFTKLFPHRLIPHYIWISKNGRVEAFTNSEEITIENVIAVLEAKKKPLIMKNDIDANRPLFLSEYIDADSLSHYSFYLRGYYPGLGVGNRFRKTGGIIHGRAIFNASIKDLYEASILPIFKENGKRYNKNFLILDVADTTKVLASKSLQDTLWSIQHRYSYDLIVPVSASKQLFHVMLSDLNRYSGYYGRIERRKVSCLVLSRTRYDKDLIGTKGRIHENSLFYRKPSKLINYPMGFLVDRLNESPEITKPVVDETGYKGHVDIILSGNLALPVLQTELKRYGLDLIETERALDMLVISEPTIGLYPSK